MAKEHIAAGSKVVPGIYRCNACANQYECTLEEQELPMCPVCDSISWRAYRLAKDTGGKSNEKS
jgi:Zn finger protein HypA/HybF involved in hydrogenase expression